jgi:hypothetical protein
VDTVKLLLYTTGLCINYTQMCENKMYKITSNLCL